MNHLGSRAIARETAILHALNCEHYPISIRILCDNIPDWISKSNAQTALDDLVYADYVERHPAQSGMRYSITDAGKEVIS